MIGKLNILTFKNSILNRGEMCNYWSVCSHQSWKTAAAAAAKSLQSCPTLWDPVDGSPPGSPVPGILQTRTLEWVAISFPMHESEKWKWSLSALSNSLWPPGLQPNRLFCPWDFPGKSTGVGCHRLLRTFSLNRTYSLVPLTVHLYWLSNCSFINQWPFIECLLCA